MTKSASSISTYRDVRKNIMRARLIEVAVVLLAVGFIGCSAESLVARGYVTGRTANGFIISIGSDDGIQNGDTLRIVRPFSSNVKEIAGKVMVVRVLGNNSSAIEVLNGRILPGDRIEKWMPKPSNQ